MSGDLINCKTAPLHRIGAIQTHGALIVFDHQGKCLAASENIESFAGTPARACIGQDVASTSWGHSLRALIERTRHARDGIHLRADVALDGRSLRALAHQRDGMILVELYAPSSAEHLAPACRADARSDRVAFIHDLKAIDDVEACAERLLDLVAELSGFDRVMLYRFSPDWHGEVIAERLQGTLQGYLGLRFPADDVPPNARVLYVLNPVRLIPDVSAPVAPVVQAPDTEVIDLTHSRLRAVHPVHLEYLGNMQVAASFSLSVVFNGNLWGMIACHHPTPLEIPFDVQCELEEYLAIACMRIGALAERASLEQHRSIEAAFDEMKCQFNELDQRDLCDGIFEMIPRIQKTFEADGCWIKLDGREQISGKVPGGYAAAALLAWFRARPDPVCACFSELPPVLRAHDELRQWASGALHLPLMKDDFIILLRREQIETVRWAGRPNAHEDGHAKLSPRSSFAQWVESVQYQSEPWLLDLLQGARRLHAELNDLLTTAHFAGLAFTDALTGLANRVRLRHFLEDALASANRSETTLAVYFLDLDGFKAINDRLGHHAGDELLRIVARRLERLMRAPDLLARLGGDEFIIVQAGLAERRDADAVIRRIQWALEQGFSIGDQQVTIGVSVGVALYPDDANTVEGLMQHADAAMYREKGPFRREA